MKSIRLVKKPGGELLPAYQTDKDRLQHLKNGSLIFADIHQPRNPDYISKYQMLMKFGFDYWSPEVPAWEGVEPEKFFPKFKEQVLILAGWYTTVWKKDGSFAIVSKSVSFDELDDEELFGEIYQSVFEVIWKLVMQKSAGMTRDEIENTVSQMMGYE
jgi:hypothetical protein